MVNIMASGRLELAHKTKFLHPQKTNKNAGLEGMNSCFKNQDNFLV